jgi:hypothetical protein
MVWVRIDDQIAHHPKFIAAGPIAAWLWVCGNAYCNKYLTDGFIPAAAIRTIGVVTNASKWAEQLVEVNLWERVDGGYRVHDFHDHNPSAADVRTRREQDRLRKRQGESGNGSSPALSGAESEQIPTGIHAESGEIPRARAQVPVPSRPFPSNPNQNPEKKEPSSANADYDAFVTAYPASRRVRGKPARRAFAEAMKGKSCGHLTTMLVALEQQKRSEQWAKGLIPLMTTWLNQERWNQELPETKQSAPSRFQDRTCPDDPPCPIGTDWRECNLRHAKLELARQRGGS